MATKFNVNAPAFSPKVGEGPVKARQADKNGVSKTKHGSKRSSQSQTIYSNSGPGQRARKDHIQRPNDEFFSAYSQDNRGLTSTMEGFRNKRGQVDISHLVELRPRQQTLFSNQGDRRRSSRFIPHTDEPIDQTTYINVTYRFVIDSRADYKDLMNNPDIPVPMGKVMRIIMSQPSACPICLEDVPEAPRMLDCGHVLCYPCLFRYLASEDVNNGSKKPHKVCPLCGERLRSDKVKPVKFLFWDDRFDTPKEDHECILRLMIRPMGSLLAVPRDFLVDGFDFDDVPDAQNSVAFQHSRLLKGDDAYAIHEYELEIQQLERSREYNKTIYKDDGVYHTMAINMIRSMIQLQKSEAAVTTSPSNEQNPVTITNESQLKEDEAASLVGIDNQLSSLSVGDLSDRNKNTSSRPPTDYTDNTAYFFYQTGFESVTKFFLSSLDSRILRTAFGSYEAFPPVLVPKVESIQYGISVNNELRKRIKYLGNLPRHTSIAFMECDWSDVVDKSILHKFGRELKQRRKLKKDRELREERNRQRYEQNQRKQLEYDLYHEASYGSPYGNDDSPHTSNSTNFNFELDPALPARQTAELLNTEESGISNSTLAPSQSDTETSTIGAWGKNSPSFAQAASTRGDPELQRMLQQAKPDRKGRKKLVLLSTNHAY